MTGSRILRGLAGAAVVSLTTAAAVVAVASSGGGDVGRHVVIIGPAAGAEVQLGERVAITAQGFDPGGVRHWEVLAAGVEVAADDLDEDAPTHVPINATWVPEHAGPATIEVRVEGPGGRERPPAHVTVTVLTSTTTTSRSTTTTARPGQTTTTSEASTTVTTLPRSSSTRATTSTEATTATTATTEFTTAPSTTPTTAPDTAAPVVAASHSPASPSDNDPITFTVTADDDRELSVVELWVQPPGANQPGLLATCSTSPCVHTAGPFRFGTLTYFGIARDGAANEGRSRTGTITIAQQPR